MLSLPWQKEKYFYRASTDQSSSHGIRFLCPRCWKSYSTKSAMRAHFKYDCGSSTGYVHLVSTNPKKASQKRDTLFNFYTGKFHCPNCNNGYGRRDTMLGHYRYECGKAPRYKCPYCALCSKKTSNVYQHVR
ncbi:hypothetical protein V1477_011868 [Vespula maculifrons]|uniref:C2H2-type domain-containing protein n=1 Tax=Vespula maculifrons TaxID=7453 RepID=A0ABD2C130_VESMC